MPLFMTTFKGLTNKNSSQVGEDERLDKGNHYFNHINFMIKETYLKIFYF